MQQLVKILEQNFIQLQLMPQQLSLSLNVIQLLDIKKHQMLLVNVNFANPHRHITLLLMYVHLFQQVMQLLKMEEELIHMTVLVLTL